MAKRKFFTSLLLSFFLVSLVPVILLGYVAMAVSARTTSRDIMEQVEASSSRATKSTGSLISSFKDGIRLLADDPEVRGFLMDDHTTDRQKVYRKMYFLLSGHSDTCMVHVVSSDGKRSLSTGVLPKEYDPQVFSSWGLLRFLNDSSDVKVYANYLLDRNVLSIGKAIRDGQGRLVGYAIVDIPSLALQDWLSEIVNTFPFAYSLLDGQGFVLFDQIGVSDSVSFSSFSFLDGVSAREQSVQGRKYFLVSTLLEGDLRLISGVPVDLVIESNQRLGFVTIAFGLLSLSLSILFSYGFAKNLSRPVSRMGAMMEKVEKGDLQVRCAVEGDDELASLSAQLNAMVDHLGTLFKENMEKQDLLRSAELKNLKAQIDPHFLYNTLDSIRYMVRLGMQKEASMAISDLAILLKNSIGNNKDMNTVAESMHVIESYLEIEKLEHPDKFQVRMDVDPSMMDLEIPKLLIQPLVENAIVHGLEEKMGKGEVAIMGTREGTKLLFIIRDDGVGMDGPTLERVMSGEDSDSIGIRNVSKRLHLYYGENASLTIRSFLRKGTEVRMVIPVDERGK